MNPESLLQNKMRSRLEEAGGMVLRVAHGPAGFPDLIGCAPDGACFLVEVKRPGRPHTLSAVQALTLSRWSRVARVGVAETVEEALDIMKGDTCTT